MTMTASLQTAGPADPAASLRAKIYAGLSALLGLITLAVTLGFLTADQGTSVAQIVQGVIGLVGAGGLAVAAAKTNKQVNNGTFDPAPVNSNLGIDNALHSIDAIKQHVDDTVNQAQAKVAEGVAAIQGAAAMIPGGSAVSSAVFSGPVGDLIQAMLDHDGK